MKIKDTWNLKLLYKSDTDPQIELDLKAIEKAYSSFEKKYKAKPFTQSPESLARALKDYEKLAVEVGGRKPWWYFALRVDLNSGDTRSAAMKTKCEKVITEAANKIQFFNLQIAKIEVREQKNFLMHKALQPYKYHLSKIFDRAKFNLTEGEEQLENSLSQTSYTMWVNAQNKLLNQQMIEHKGIKMPISQASNKIADMGKKDRREVHSKITHTLKSISHMAEAEINAVYNYKNTMDQRRGFSKPYSETILRYENDEKAIEAFVSLVTKHFSISRRFYKLHAKLLGEKKITYPDRGVKIGVIKKKFDFPTSVSILRSILEKTDPEYVVHFDKFLTNGEIDVYPRKGKKGGAYSWEMEGLPVYVLLNHVDTVNSFDTLAHEIGHALHTEMSRKQPILYHDYTTATAEVASTFFEQLAGDEIEKYLSEKEKVIMLHNRIMGDMSTIFRQIACFNFEHELHLRIRKEGQLGESEIAQLMKKHLVSYLGDAVSLTPDDGYAFVNWMHIRRFFYVYTYAYGQLISRALYENYKKDHAYAKKVKQFLSAGGSMSPEEIFKSIGIDTSKTSFFEEGLKSIEKDIDRLEKLTR